MPNFKIEKVKMQTRRPRTLEFHKFLETLKQLKPGESFLIPYRGSLQMTAITIARTLLNAEYQTRKEGNSVRVGRTK